MIIAVNFTGHVTFLTSKQSTERHRVIVIYNQYTSFPQTMRCNSKFVSTITHLSQVLLFTKYIWVISETK